MKKQNIVSMTATIFGFLLLCQTESTMAVPKYFDNSCKSCHGKVEKNTCNGCHAHGTHSSSAKNDINLTANTDKLSYQPGEPMTITIKGGYKPGWVRVYLYSNPNAEGTPIAKSTGPDGQGGGPALPVSLTVQAPTEPGTYTYSASWYGNKYDKKVPFFGNWRESASNLDHGEEIVPSNPFTVSGEASSEVPSEASATRVIQR